MPSPQHPVITPPFDQSAHATAPKLWLDMGNTRLKYWLMAGDTLLAMDAKEHLKAPNELLLGLMPLFGSFGVEFIGISSVLGERLNQQISRTLDKLSVHFEFARVQAHHPAMDTNYHAGELGVDRWLQMLGAVSDKKLCVVGCGTALTIDLIDGRVHLGGYIFPNVYLQRQALYSGTRQIEVATGSFHSTDIGQNTTDAVNHGILLSVVGAVNEIRRRHSDYGLILTGGGALNLARQLTDLQSHQLPLIKDDLLLTGLRRYFKVQA